MIQIEDRQHPGVAAPRLQMLTDVGMFEMGFECGRNDAADPFVKVTENDTRTSEFGMADNSLFKKPPRLLTVFHYRRSKMNVEDVQQRAVNLNICAEAATFFTSRG